MAKTLRLTGITFLVLGFTMLQFVGYELYGTSLRTNAAQSALATSLDRTLTKPLREPSPEAEPPVTTLPESDGGVVGWARISIPKISLANVLVEGATRVPLMEGPGHYDATPLPGTPGAVGIAGHRTTWGAPFQNLDKLDVGDLIVIQSPAGRYRYSVTGSVIVDPGDAEVLFGDPNSDAEHKLVLTTCTPKYSAAKRLIVYADLTSWQVAS